MVYFSVAEDKCDLFLFLERRILPERLFITEIFTQNQSRSARSVRPSIIYIEDKRFKRKKKIKRRAPVFSCSNTTIPHPLFSVVCWPYAGP